MEPGCLLVVEALEHTSGEPLALLCMLLVNAMGIGLATVVRSRGAAVAGGAQLVHCRGPAAQAAMCTEQGMAHGCALCVALA